MKTYTSIYSLLMVLSINLGLSPAFAVLGNGSDKNCEVEFSYEAYDLDIEDIKPIQLTSYFEDQLMKRDISFSQDRNSTNIGVHLEIGYEIIDEGPQDSDLRPWVELNIWNLATSERVVSRSYFGPWGRPDIGEFKKVLSRVIRKKLNTCEQIREYGASPSGGQLYPLSRK